MARNKTALKKEFEYVKYIHIVHLLIKPSTMIIIVIPS